MLMALALMIAPAAATPAPQVVPPAPQLITAAQRRCTRVTKTGLGYRVLKVGKGAERPARDSVVGVRYMGHLATTGALFDSSNESIFAVDGVVSGFGEGLQLMQRGGIYRFCIPARLAYGSHEMGSIPPNSDLVFRVELHDFISRAEYLALVEEAKQKSATPAANAPASDVNPEQAATP